MTAAIKGAANEAVAAGEGPVQKRTLKPCSAKRAAGIGSSELYRGSGKKLRRLPQEEVAWILAHRANEDRAPPEVKALRRLDRGLWPSPEEEENTDGYGPRAYIETEEEFAKFQACVRREHGERGYVEVDDEFLAARDKVRSWSDQARERALRRIDFAGHEDLKRFFSKTWPLM